jgi:hypothetical protein
MFFKLALDGEGSVGLSIECFPVLLLERECFFQLALDDEGSVSYIIGCFLYFGGFL